MYYYIINISCASLNEQQQRSLEDVLVFIYLNIFTGQARLQQKI